MPTSAQPDTGRQPAVQRDYVAIILARMAETGTAQRQLAAQTGMSKSRLGVLLHRDPAKRGAMMLAEFERILNGLDIDLVEAFIRHETFQAVSERDGRRHAALVAMLCEFFVSLPARLIDTLEDVDGIDGSEVRREWAFPLQRAVINRVADEVRAVTERRARLAQSDDFRI